MRQNGRALEENENKSPASAAAPPRSLISAQLDVNFPPAEALRAEAATRAKQAGRLDLTTDAVATSLLAPARRPNVFTSAGLGGSAAAARAGAGPQADVDRAPPGARDEGRLPQGTPGVDYCLLPDGTQWTSSDLPDFLEAATSTASSGEPES